jgi:protein-tyrosine phosphatase
MIDIHCHILPAVDDGADDVECGLQMARQAVGEGIRTMIATPHHGNGRFVNERESIIESVAKWNAILQAEGVPLDVLPGQEVHLRREWLDDLAAGRLQTLNGTRYLLLELQNHRLPDSLNDVLHELEVVGLRAIIAHPERHPVFMKQPSLLREWVEAGAYLQLTSHSLTGEFGSKIQAVAQKIVKDRLVHFVASDAHHPKFRAVSLKAAHAQVAKLVGPEYVDYILSNAVSVVANHEVEKYSMPQPQKKWYKFF